MTRELCDLVSVGPAAIEDFKKLNISSVEDLQGRDALDLYNALCTLTERRHCICVIDVFAAAIAQAENPDLPHEQCEWFYYSRLRKSACRNKVE